MLGHSLRHISLVLSHVLAFDFVNSPLMLSSPLLIQIPPNQDYQTSHHKRIEDGAMFKVRSGTLLRLPHQLASH